MTQQAKTIIGRAELITLVDVSDQPVPAKVDTGADRSSIWASQIKVQDGHLHFVLFDKNSNFYTGEVIKLPANKFSRTIVENSFGQREQRFLVHLRVRIGGRLVRASFSLADRQSKTYPILLGRKLLSGKFLVDTSIGTPLKDVERQKKRELMTRLQDQRRYL